MSFPDALSAWRTFLAQTPAAAEVFAAHPTPLMEYLATRQGRRQAVVQYLRRIRRSAWRNELLLALACDLLRGRYARRLELECFRNAAFFLDRCATLAGGRALVDPEVHLKVIHVRENESHFHNPRQPRVNLDRLYSDFYCVLQVVEEVLPTLPLLDQRRLQPHQIGLHTDHVHEMDNPPTLAFVRSMMPPDLQDLRDTPFDVHYRGPAPSTDILRFFSNVMTNPQISQTPHFIAAALYQVAAGVPQAEVLRTLDACFPALLYLDDGHPEGNRPGMGHQDQHFQIRQAGAALSCLAATLRQHLHLQPLADTFAYIEAPSEVTLERPRPGGRKAKRPLAWADVLVDVPPDHPFQLAFEQLLPISGGSSSQDRLVTDAVKLLWRANCQPFEYTYTFAVAVLCLLVNREHRPSSALLVLRDLGHLLRALAEHRLEYDGPGSLGEHVLRVLEAKTSGDREIARRQRMKVAYQTAVQAERTFLNSYPHLEDAFNWCLLPALPRRAYIDTPTGEERDRHAEQRREDIDHVADHWVALHQEADRRFVALRTVSLAVRSATQRLRPADLQRGEPLSMAIPGRDETWAFVIWTKATFYRHVHGRAPDRPIKDDRFFLEYVGASSPHAALEGLWCADILRGRLDAEAAAHFEAEWNSPLRRLRAGDAGVLNNGRDLGSFLQEAARAFRAQGRPVPCVFDHDALYRGVLFGTLAMRLGRYGGHRGHELLQLQTSPEALFVALHRGHESLVMRCFPKGWKGTRVRPSREGIKVITPDALRVIEAVVADRRFGGTEGDADGHVFWSSGRVVSLGTLNACLRLMLHGPLMRHEQLQLDTDGEGLLGRSHLMRYAFGIHARRSGVSRDDLAIVYNHADPDMTDRYSRPTRLEALGVVTGIQRVTSLWPGLERQGVPEARPGLLGAAETLLRVPGGQCTFLAECRDTKLCVGCALKRPDPALREEAQAGVAALRSRFEQARAAGWQDARTLARQLHAAEQELDQMNFQQGLEHIEGVLDEQEQQLLLAVRRGRA